MPGQDRRRGHDRTAGQDCSALTHKTSVLCNGVAVAAAINFQWKWRGWMRHVSAFFDGVEGVGQLDRMEGEWGYSLVYTLKGRQ